MPGPKPKPFEQYFERGDGCWEWSGRRNDDGYGKFRIRGREVLAHRHAYQLEHGPIPAGVLVCHECDNPPCVRPSHLFPSTPLGNMRDKIKKGRARSYRRPGRTWSKVTPETAAEIRADPDKQKVIAARHGISQQLVSRIKRGEAW